MMKFLAISNDNMAVEFEAEDFASAEVHAAFNNLSEPREIISSVDCSEDLSIEEFNVLCDAMTEKLGSVTH